MAAFVIPLARPVLRFVWIIVGFAHRACLQLLPETKVCDKAGKYQPPKLILFRTVVTVQFPTRNVTGDCPQAFQVVDR
ncbi:hypothetical protein HPQ64_13120 [Rhizobiales bacterium]|uniref:hypothetical protein n=1 Tax=Hongsoonwoonella zoysiae TaxID=2821844 RepID=UPI00155F7695|nr:hypothetical protein [Hongsoonwoonella zoysiae]NRG18631.1 hypothetical protein [Hongsoonwoonella zoysiae]